MLLVALGAAEAGPATGARVQPEIPADGTKRPRRLLRYRGLDAQRRRTPRVHAELVRLPQAQTNKKKTRKQRERGRGRMAGGHFLDPSESRFQIVGLTFSAWVRRVW